MKVIGKKRSRIDYLRQSALGRYVLPTILPRSIDDVDVKILSVERERERTRDHVSAVGRVKERTRRREKGRIEEEKKREFMCAKFAQNEPHTGVCDVLCEFENVLFSKENRTHKSHKFT